MMAPDSISFSYPFGELLDHLHALQVVSKYENVTLEDGEEMELPGDRRTFADMSLRVMDYMRQLYASEEEAFFKGSRLVMILNHATAELEKFEDARLAVIGSEESGSLMAPRAWRALHHFYVDLRFSDEAVTTERVIAYALGLAG